MQQGLSEAARRQDTSVVKAVAEAWRDDEPTITAVTKTWLSSAKSETILKTLIRGREVSVSAAPVADEYKAPLLLVASAEFALLIVVVSALYLAHRLSIALPAIVAIVLLMASGLLLISYWKKKPEERNPTFWWVASLCMLRRRPTTERRSMTTRGRLGSPTARLAALNKSCSRRLPCRGG